MIMVGDKEVHSNGCERTPVQPDTLEYSTEIVLESVRRQCTIIPSAKRMVQPLISVAVKKSKMNSIIAKRKREKVEPEDPCEKDWGEELYSNSSNYELFDEYSKGKLATFCQLSSSTVYHGQCSASNVSDIPNVELSDFENISEQVKKLTIEGGQESLALMVEYSGQYDIVGKDLNEHIANSYISAKTPALE